MAEVESNLQTVCEQLDNIVIQVFSTLSDLYAEQARLEASLKSGFLNMSRARYTMGVKSVSMDQCDENNMSAVVKVKVTPENQLKSYNPDLDIESQFSDLDLEGKIPDTESNLRKRNVRKPERDYYEKKDSHIEEFINKAGENGVELKDLSDKTRKKVFDPIKWFGVLVPTTLRQSQSDFKATVDAVVTVANLKIKLQELQKEYKELMLKKEELS
ncbi:coiled-coil domain-containing protein 115-like [Mya arenaria]|uniref:coiled-coil domain-containing protein 115-like n=1 Tax=Mya arenaria TaxID=6604 RepID=UPI0022E8DC9C|nr:coiled-coil domain-containing protein 115-like [Mya arenaria]